MSGVVVDTSVWVDHFRQPNGTLIALLVQDRVLIHPLVLGEVACGAPPQRSQTLSDLETLQQPQQAKLQEVLAFIEREQLFGLGCGWIDLNLLASTLMTPGARLWTADKRLGALAERFSVPYLSLRH
ncbi:type II toxin-antitoxin system VapC family toxin [Roseateles cellulosilyticus]|uniref:VapC toxin family PIN domain ribonuclease n=1 Tax=Pelomonas cellulosilytica TaxID=2906762 RepID=A0ABS8XSE6_9BURK|nr:VapC toxin family PIN domain ribonuclease [Pelomonas sp. P8]MCE4555632.1 VapC toxin family PIN domain ribonuclease [Pelomonas sp. P8]